MTISKMKKEVGHEEAYLDRISMGHDFRRESRMLSIVVMMVWTHLCFSEISHPCSFNTMCSCRSTNSSYIKDVSCVGVPFYKLP
ncbi:hypothetical protein J6590_105811, partial [Homalodisca vitripennis]